MFCGLCARAKVNLFVGCFCTPVLGMSTPHLERGFAPMFCSAIITSVFHSLMPAAISAGSSQKEQKPAPWMPAPTRSSSPQQHLCSVSVALVTWASWPGHFAHDSLVLPFVSNQIVKIRYQRLTCTCRGPRATLLDASTTRNQGSE